MKKIITATLLGGAITASLLGAGVANASPDEYVGKTPEQLVQISIERSIALPGLQGQALARAHQAFVAGEDETVKKIIGDVVDGPQWAIDPAIEALAQKLPKPVGGTNGDSYTPEAGGTHGPDADGSLMQYRNNQMLKARDTARANVQAHVAKAGEVRDAIKGALTPKPAPK
jgi:hypothetical protein